MLKKISFIFFLVLSKLIAQIALPTFQGVHKPQSHTANGQLNYEVHTSTTSYYADTYTELINNQGSLEASGTTSDIGGPTTSDYGLINIITQSNLEDIAGNV